MGEIYRGSINSCKIDQALHSPRISLNTNMHGAVGKSSPVHADGGHQRWP